jgi:hypothetical protein
VRRTADPSASLGMTKGTVALRLRAVVLATKGVFHHLDEPQAHDSSGRDDNSFATQRRETFVTSTTMPNGNAPVPFVIPSEAEGSAVRRPFPGNVSRRAR